MPRRKGIHHASIATNENNIRETTRRFIRGCFRPRCRIPKLSFAQGKDYEEYPSPFSMPWDAKVHTIKPTGQIARSQYIVYNRTNESTGAPTSLSMSNTDENGCHVAVMAGITTFKSGGVRRELILYFDSKPRDSEAIVASIPFDYRQAIQLRMKFASLLRIGRNWRNEGTTTGEKSTDLSI
jgi:hypothetical protein